MCDAAQFGQIRKSERPVPRTLAERERAGQWVRLPAAFACTAAASKGYVAAAARYAHSRILRSVQRIERRLPCSYAVSARASKVTPGTPAVSWIEGKHLQSTYHVLQRSPEFP
jgi:hypothetical protein